MQVLGFAGLVLALGCGSADLPPPEPAKPPASTASDKAAAKAKVEREGVAALVGTKPPEWQAERWMGSEPLSLAALRGQVVLVRWWTAGCPFCSTTAPALRDFHEAYGARGLRVVGMYHHKEETPFDPKVYEETAQKYGFTFPVAFDTNWRTLQSWLRDARGNPVSTGWTSVTFVLDKQGVIRHVHPGGSYQRGQPGYTEMQATIEHLLAE